MDKNKNKKLNRYFKWENMKKLETETENHKT